MCASDELTLLWSRFRAGQDVESRNRLVLQYAPLVKYVAGRVRSGLPATVEQADLVSEGVLGLMDAIEKFDPDRGIQFQTYAIPRIRGAIIDWLRAADWVPRSVRDKIRAAERARAILETRLGRPATEGETAEELGISVRELREGFGRVSHPNPASIDELGELEDLTSFSEEVLEDRETRTALLQAIGGLAERDRIIVALYYFEGLTLAEIGQVLGVTESRVSQLHARVALSLHARLTAGSGAQTVVNRG